MSPASPPPLQTRRRIPWAALIIGCGVTLVLSPFIIFGVWRSGVSRDIAALEKKARDAGEPITLEELAALRKPVPDDENVFVALMEIWAEEDPDFWRAFRDRRRPLPEQLRPEFDSELPVLGRKYVKADDRLPWTEAEHRAATEFVRTNAARADRVKAALTRPQAEFPIDTAAGYAVELPHLSRIRHEGQQLELAALLAMAESQVDPAIDALEQMLRLAECLRDDPYSICQLVRMAVHGLVLDTTEELLTHARPDAAQLQRLKNLLTGLRVEKALYQSLLGERVAAASLFNTPIEKLVPNAEGSQPAEDAITGPLNQGMSLQNSPLNAIGFFSRDRLLMLQTYDQLTTLSRDGNWENIVKAESVIANATAAADKFPPRIMTSMLLIPLAKAGNRFINVEVRRRGALLALEVERRRREQDGQLPVSLETLRADFAVELLTDPYTGQPLRYAVRSNGYVIYSLGPDQQDQQGATVAPRGQPAAYDVAFTIGSRERSTRE